MLLNDTNFLLYAAKAYDIKKSATADEFYEDLKRFQYLKRLFRRYEESGDLKLRLILNHIIILYNCFGPLATHMLFFKLKEHHSLVKPFVVFLQYMPDYITYENLSIPNSDIPLNSAVVQELRKIQ